MNLFVYGTLMDDEFVVRLTGRRVPREAAVLSGYQKIVPEGGYPYLVPDADGKVDGFLLRDVDSESLRLFDQYEDEGRLYRRTAAIVSVAGRQQHCMTYVGIAAAHAHRSLGV